MARKTPPRPPEIPHYLAVPREEATQRITDRIKRGEDLKSRAIDTDGQLEEVRKDYWTWDEYNEEMLRRMFSTTKIAEEYSPSRYFFSVGQDSFQVKIKHLRDDIDTKIRTLTSIIERLELVPLAPGLTPVQATSRSTATPSNQSIFLVHGHDEGTREAVARFLDKLKLDPIILHEQANQGRTVVEKLEHYGDVSYAVVLLTPDDVGGLGPSELQPRARQNVVLELGYFIARLGRKNVCAVYRGELELPSDYMGVIYVHFDSGGGWRFHLARELKAAGFSIDMNNAI
jgi:predicted nucleotide-binding protein